MKVRKFGEKWEDMRRELIEKYNFLGLVADRLSGEINLGHGGNYRKLDGRTGELLKYCHKEEECCC